MNSSCALIGIKIPLEKFFVKKIKQKFEHDYPPSYKFDPMTGKKLWEEIVEPVNGFEVKQDQQGTFLGYKIFLADAAGTVSYTRYEAKDKIENRVAFLGVGCCSEWNQEKLQFPENFNSDKFLLEIKSRLEPIGLWDENYKETFGLWAFKF